MKDAAVKGNAALWAAVARFNAPRAEDFAPESLPEESAALLRAGTLARLEASRAGRALVRAWLLRHWGAEPGFADFADERRRLALLGRDVLRRLALVYGGCLYAREAALCVRREEAAALRALLGEHYAYVLSRGRLLVMRGSEYFSAFKKNLPLPERMAGAGFHALRLCLAFWPADLFRLASCRLPAELRPAAKAASGGRVKPAEAALAELVWTDVKKLLLVEVAPQWQACFA
ncbi:MAG: SctK family type III secretion system sorting platform protein [Deltaproteobacteria bacterium]|nr:SctK family type III secretion system sorting platform protein [Deltaproteobacteria bacterium]